MPPEAIPPRGVPAHAQPADALGAIILGGAHSALAIARCLGRAKIPCVLVTDDHPLPKFSRYIQKRFDWPGPLAPHAAEWLLDLGVNESLHGWTLFPCADADVHFVASESKRLSAAFNVISCSWDVLQQLCDKQLLPRHAAACNVDFPKSYTLSGEDDAWLLDIQFPVVLKPSLRESANAFTHAKAWGADNRDEFVQRYRQAAGDVGDGHIVVQEFIPGGGETQFSYAAVWLDGAPKSELVVRRTRQFPIEFSTSTFVEVVENETVRDAARRLLTPLRFRGLVEMEFKYDQRDGRHKVIDVNPRSWSWLGLAEALGLNMPLRIVRPEADRPSAAPAFRPIAWIHLPRDLLAAAGLIHRGVLTLPGYLRSLRGKRLVFASFAPDDPWPGIAELPIAAIRALSRRLSQFSSARGFFGGEATARLEPPQRRTDPPPSAGLPPAA